MRAHLLLLSIAIAPAAHCVAQSIVDIGVLNSGPQRLLLSADGSVAFGTSSNGAFRWTSATGAQNIGTMPGTTSSAILGMSRDGSAVVGLAGGPNTAAMFRWTVSQGFQDLGVPLSGTFDGALNADGSVVVGLARAPDFQTIGFRLAAGSQIEYLDRLPGTGRSYAFGVSGDGTTVVGEGDADISGFYRPHAYRWTQATGTQSLIDPSVASISSAYAISGDGSVITGWASDSFLHERAYRWTESGGVQFLGDVPGFPAAYGLALNDDGSAIVGTAYAYPDDMNRLAHATLWTPSLGIVDLNTYLPSFGIDLQGWTLDEAWGVSDNGQVISGNGTLNGQPRAWIVNVPSPGVLAAAFTLAIRRRRRV